MYDKYLKYKDVYHNKIADQDLLNDIAQDKIGYLPIKFGIIQPYIKDDESDNLHLINQFEFYQFNESRFKNKFSFLPNNADEFFKQSNNPVIIHSWNGKWENGGGLSVFRRIAQYYIRYAGICWDTKNIIDIGSMFCKNSALKKLPDIPKWKVDNVVNLTSLFAECSSLEEIPDISLWNTANVQTIKGLFSNCISLKTLPDISKWDTKNMKYISFLFRGCKSLLKLPDISLWNINNISELNFLFEDCSSLESLPDISKWDTKNITA